MRRDSAPWTTYAFTAVGFTAATFSDAAVGAEGLCVACSALFAWAWLERKVGFRVPKKVARAIDLVIVTAILLVAATLLGSGVSDLVMLGRILVISQFARAVRRKSRADLAVMHGTALLQLALAAFVTQEVGFLILIVAGVVVGTAARLGALHHDVDLSRGVRLFVARPQGTARKRSFVGAAAGSLSITLALVLLGTSLFVLLPRGVPFREKERRERNEVVDPTDYSKDQEMRREAVAGFSERVVLGDVGRIKNTPWRAFLVQLKVRGVASRMYEKDLYFRGLSYDTYGVSGWTRSRRLRAQRRWQRTVGGPKTLALYGPENVPSLPSRLIRQEFEMEGSKSSVLFGLDRLVEIELMPEMPRVLRLGDGAYAAPRPHENGFVYRVTSDPVQTLELSGLPLEDRARFLSMPPESTQIANLARTIAGEDTARVKGERLSNWLRENCAYTLSFRERAGRDALSDFLFETRAGHCEYFATALAVLLRAVDVPSRIVVGYRGGQWIDDERSYLVWQKDAHAWVEAWIDGRGWVRLDATPGDPDAVRVDPGRVPGIFVQAPPGEGDGGMELLAGVRDFGPKERGKILEGAADVIGFVFREGFGLGRPERGFPPPLLVVLLGIAGYAGVRRLVGVLPGRFRRKSESRRRQASQRTFERGFYDEALRSLRGRGLVRRGSQSPREFLTAAGPFLGDDEKGFRTVTGAFEVVRYAQGTLEAGEVERLNLLARELRGSGRIGAE